MKKEFSLLSLTLAGAVTAGAWLGTTAPVVNNVSVPMAVQSEAVALDDSTGATIEDAAYHHKRYYRHGYYVHHRSGRKRAAIIGGSALGGAAIGGALGGGKGALIGAAAGGTGGALYDHHTNKKVVRY